ncbi:TraR/DksA C4-type zinc finger protein [Vibrio sp. MarTm2]|uniref:TraR/DksA C4-type zinc finger protein n=1 Tax=Vibrio TaxID=662 RepID=UPI000C86B8BD|nr:MULTISPECIES: TraR/DksA C4-type zinc finger protein [Vibrio]MDA0126501.1 TraR/DksA C4-type zinc finger protein [Vibrio sp. MarTm2]PMS49922.1 conjugal transfer protein TraR [Vibrio parahaemolyticus]PMS54993.1 conjugal transfer protein TraR [Vibrio parahaemolyticus]PMS60322.1 conjugal transfer protein TraR [Vibrio parahaemolyticus]PMS90410.1 conjugal transfer protein TraR [Vibrio parahaemolyticus]
MSDQLDQAQELEQLFRDKALNQQLMSRCAEQPDEDQDGNRYCLSCGATIPPKRIKAQPNAVRCVSCQSRKEP